MKKLSLLSNYVENIPTEFIEEGQKLNWETETGISMAELKGMSPTTEYSSKEDDE